MGQWHLREMLVSKFQYLSDCMSHRRCDPYQCLKVKFVLQLLLDSSLTGMVYSEVVKSEAIKHMNHNEAGFSRVSSKKNIQGKV